MTNQTVRKTLTFPAGVYSDIELISRSIGFTPSAVINLLLSESIEPLSAYLRSNRSRYPLVDVTIPLRRHVDSSNDDLKRALLVLRDYSNWYKGGQDEEQLDLL